MTTLATSENACVNCGWEPENAGKWPTFGRIAVNWIQDNVILGEGDWVGSLIRLRPDQKRFLWRWYEYCPVCDWWRYDEALRGEARGGGKTGFIAAIAVLEFAGPPQLAPVSPNVVIGAASWEQADILYSAATTALGGRDQVMDEAPLCGYFEVYDSETKFADHRPGRLFRTAAVAGTNQGGNPTLTAFDEEHEYGDIGSAKATYRNVVAMGAMKRTLTYRIPDGNGGIREVKRGPGRRISLSTAGFDIDHSMLGAKYKRCKREAQQHLPTRLLFDWVEAPDGLDYAIPAQRAIACRAASGAADIIWSVDARVALWDDPTVPHHEWIRYYANRWVDVAEESWLSEHPAAWAKCQGTWQIQGPEPGVLAVDMALKRDSVAVVEVRALPDGRYAVTARIWEPVEGKLPHLEIWEYIRSRAVELADAFRGVVYDPRFFELAAERLEEDHNLLVIQFDQSPVRMAPAVGLTYDAILAGTVVHDGDAELGRQVKAAVKRQQERGFTLSKGKSRIHIDGAVAMCMGIWALAELEGKNEPDPLQQIW